MEPKQIDVLSDGMSKLLYQWKDSPNLQAFLRALLLQLKDVEVSYYQLLNERGIYVAVGAQLDLLGKLVGEPRLGRSDTPYRQAILGRVALNQASGTIDDVKHTVKTIADTDFVALFEHHPLATYVYVPQYLNRDAEKIIDRAHIAGARTRVLWTEEPENIIFSDLDQASYTELLHTGEGDQILVNDNGIFELQVSFHSFIASESYFTSIVPGATSYEVVDDKGKMASLVPLQEVDVATGYIIDQDGNYLIDNFGNYISYVVFGSLGEQSPTNLQAVYSDPDEHVTLTWGHDGPEADEFRVYRSTSSIDTGNPGTPLAVVSGSLREYIDDTVSEGETYYYTVSSVFGLTGLFGNEVSISIQTSTPIWGALPQGLNADGTGGMGLFDVAGDDNGTFIAVGESGNVTRSTDYGVTWTALPPGLAHGFPDTYEVVATDGNGTWIITDGSGFASRSTDNGDTWDEVVIFATGGPTSGFFRSITTDGNGNWMAVGELGKAYVSIADGVDTSWALLPPGLDTGNPNLTSNSVATDGNGRWIVAANNGVAVYSDDLGATWTEYTNGIPTTNINAVATDGNGTWIMVAGNGTASISTDGGDTWNALPDDLSQPDSPIFRCITTDGNGTWVVGSGNDAQSSYSDDNGATWTALPQGANSGAGGGTVNRAIAHGGGVWVMVNDNGWAARNPDPN